MFVCNVIALQTWSLLGWDGDVRQSWKVPSLLFTPSTYIKYCSPEVKLEKLKFVVLVVPWAHAISVKVPVQPDAFESKAICAVFIVLELTCIWTTGPDAKKENHIPLFVPVEKQLGALKVPVIPTFEYSPTLEQLFDETNIAVEQSSPGAARNNCILNNVNAKNNITNLIKFVLMWCFNRFNPQPYIN